MEERISQFPPLTTGWLHCGQTTGTATQPLTPSCNPEAPILVVPHLSCFPFPQARAKVLECLKVHLCWQQRVTSFFRSNQNARDYIMPLGYSGLSVIIHKDGISHHKHWLIIIRASYSWAPTPSLVESHFFLALEPGLTVLSGVPCHASFSCFSLLFLL